MTQSGVKILGNLTSMARQGATLGNSSFLGTYLLFNFFFALYLFFSTKAATKIFSAISAIFILVSLFFSTARAATLAALGGIVVLMLLFLIFKRGKKAKIAGIVLSGIIFLGLIAGIYFAFIPNNPVNSLVGRYIGSSFGGRIPVWQSAWKGFLDRPALGWGPENFELVFTKYYNPCLGGPLCGGDVWYDRAHNIIIDTLVATGVLGFLSYLGIFLAVFYALWKKFSKQIADFWTTSIFFVILLAYFVQNLTVFDMVNSYLLFFLVLAFAASVAQIKDQEPAEPADTKPANALFTILIVIVFLLPFAKFIVQPLSADKDIILALGKQPGSAARIEIYKKILGESRISKYQIRDFFAQEALSVIQNKDTTEAQLQNMKSELDFLSGELEKSIKESPWDFRAYFKLGQVYDAYAILFDASKLARAEEIMRAALVVSPTNQQGYWTLAQTLLYKGKENAPEIISLAQKAESLDPTQEQGHLVAIQVATIMGDNALAQQEAKEALKINPAWEADINGILKK
jgi:hypothetical protein